MYFHDLGTFYDDTTLLDARDKALGKLSSMQVTGTGVSRLDGAFRSVYECGPADAPGAGELCVNNRTAGYALMALLKLESDIADIWLGRHDRRFVDPCDDPARADAIVNGLIW